MYTVPPVPLPMRLMRSSSENFSGVGGQAKVAAAAVADEVDDGAELGGKGSGTANFGSLCGSGSVKSGLRR